MALTLLQSYHAIAPGNLQVSVGATGGTPPYIFSVVPGGAGGTIGSATGLYTSPLTATGEDELMVVDSSSTPLIATGSMLVCTPLELVCDIIQTSMGLSQGQVYLWDQKINIPTDSRLYVVVGVQNCRPFANRPRFVGGSASFIAEQTVNMLATLTIDILSRGPAARDQKELVLLAMSGPYSLQQQELNSFYLATLPTSMVNLSHIDGAAIPYRFQILANLQYFSKLTTNPGYFEDAGSFSVITDPPQHELPEVIVKLLDMFQDVNGTLLENHVMDVGPGWTNENSPKTLQIQSNTLVAGTTGVPTTYFSDAGVTGGTVTLDVDLAINESELDIYLGETSTPSSPGWILVTNPYILLNNVYLYEYSGVGQVATVSHTFSAGPQTWKVIFDASQIAFYINDVLITSYANPGLHGTKFGFYVGGAIGGFPTNCVFTQFEVTVPS